VGAAASVTVFRASVARKQSDADATARWQHAQRDASEEAQRSKLLNDPAEASRPTFLDGVAQRGLCTLVRLILPSNALTPAAV
jgi:hypothetical protein